jgi:hypothetical protein
MRIPRLFAPLMALALVPGAAVGGLAVAGSSSVLGSPAYAGGAPSQPTLVDVRAAHHPGFDRVVFEFRGGLPADHHARYVDRLIADGSGNKVRIAGRAILQLRMSNARSHGDGGGPSAPGRTAYPLPNVMTTVRSGDFEGVVTYGIGLAKRTTFHVSTLHHPARVVVDVRAAFRTVQRKVWFFDKQRFDDNNAPFFVPRLRPVIPLTSATGLMDRLFAGVLTSERAGGLRLIRSEANGVTIRSISSGIARVQLTGGCSSGGSTVTIAGEIMPTLRHLTSVSWVKIYGPSGHTEHPLGQRDSIPACLEP